MKTELVKKKKGRTEDQTSERRRKKKGRRRPNPGEEGIKKKKKSKVKRCGCGSLHICLITKMPLSYELWKWKTAKMCFQFP